MTKTKTEKNKRNNIENFHGNPKEMNIHCKVIIKAIQWIEQQKPTAVGATI